MKTKTLITTFAKMAALTGLVATSHAITIGDTVGTGGSAELGGVPIMVDYGSAEYVSDLSNGALRFNNANVSSTSIYNNNLIINGLTELAFDWKVYDDSDTEEVSFFAINEVESIFHDGVGKGNPFGTVSQFLDTGVYRLRVTSVTSNQDGSRYQLTMGNLRLNPLSVQANSVQNERSGVTDVPDSSLGFLGIATIFAVLGAGRRYSVKKTS